MAAIPGLSKGKVNGLYEPCHGSAPDIAGQGIVNPIAAILSLAMLFKYSLHMEKEGRLIEDAVRKVLDSKDAGGYELRTKDLGGSTTTAEMGDGVCKALKTLL